MTRISEGINLTLPQCRALSALTDEWTADTVLRERLGMQGSGYAGGLGATLFALSRRGLAENQRLYWRITASGRSAINTQGER